MAYQNGGFDRDRAVADIEVLLARPVPADGPTESEYDPLSGERTGTAGRASCWRGSGRAGGSTTCP